MTFLGQVCRTLASAGIRYAVVGGYAVALHGAVRGTVDVDVVVDWNRKALASAEQALAAIGLVSRLPITAEDVFFYRDEYVRNRNLLAWNFYSPENPAEQVDVLLDYDLKGKRLHTVDTADGPIRVLGIRDLIRMKQASGRPQDLEDVDALERLL